MDALSALEDKVQSLERRIRNLEAGGAPGGRRVYRIADVRRATGLGRSTIYRYEEEGDFPKRFPLGDGSVGWDGDEVQAWIAERKTQPVIRRRVPG